MRLGRRRLTALARGVAALVAGTAILAPVAAAPAPAGQEGGGRPDRPLGVVTPGPLRALFLDPPLADVRARAEPGLTLRWWAANSWSSPTALARAGQVVVVQLDAQSDVLSATGRLAWGDLFPDSAVAARLESSVEARLVHHWGGWSDGPIETWHRLARFNDFSRPHFPQDAVALTVGGVGPPLAAVDHPVTGLGDAVLRTWLRLAEGERLGAPWALALRADLKAPLGRPSQLTGSGGVDAALALAASGPLLPWLTGHAMVTAGVTSPLPAASPLQPRRWPLGAEVSLVARRGPDWALLVEDRLQSALFERGWRYLGDEPSQGDALMAVTRVQNQVSVGVRWRDVTAWFSEDFMLGNRDGVGARWFYDSNAPDFVIGVAVSR